MSWEAQAAHEPLPGAGAQITVPNASSSAEVDLSAFIGRRLIFVASVKTHIRAGVAGLAAAATTDVWIPAEVPVKFKVTAARSRVRVYGTAAGVLNYATIDE
jgi:hypothetical protein